VGGVVAVMKHAHDGSSDSMVAAIEKFGEQNNVTVLFASVTGHFQHQFIISLCLIISITHIFTRISCYGIK
jgi:hypothetical protein